MITIQHEKTAVWQKITMSDANEKKYIYKNKNREVEGQMKQLW